MQLLLLLKVLSMCLIGFYPLFTFSFLTTLICLEIMVVSIISCVCHTSMLLILVVAAVEASFGFSILMSLYDDKSTLLSVFFWMMGVLLMQPKAKLATFL